MPTESPHSWLARALALCCALGACSDASPVLRSGPPSGFPPAQTSDAAVVVHGASPHTASGDTGDASLGREVTGSVASGDGTSRAGDAAARADSAEHDEAVPPVSAPASERLDASTPDSPAAASGVSASTPEAGAGGDAGTPDRSVPVAPASRAPAWAAPLLGRYAVRTYIFNQDDFGTVTRAEQLAIAEFVSDGDAVVLHTELCLSTIENALSRMRMLDPTELPVRSEQVRYSEVEHTWSTEGPTFAMGYVREAPAACTGHEGKDVPKLAGQAWLRSTCRCSTVVDDLKVDDCRVDDPDGDEQPGLSYAMVVKATGSTTTYYAAMASNSHFVNGQIASDGGVPSATIKADEQPYQFGCSPAGCLNIASLGKACPSSFTRALFVRLASSDTVSCADLVVRASALFPAPAPGYPAHCL